MLCNRLSIHLINFRTSRLLILGGIILSISIYSSVLSAETRESQTSKGEQSEETQTKTHRKPVKANITYSKNFKVSPLSEAPKFNYVRSLNVTMSSTSSQQQIHEKAHEICGQYSIERRKGYHINIALNTSPEPILSENCSKLSGVVLPEKLRQDTHDILK